jgi:hypothetical protein
MAKTRIVNANEELVTNAVTIYSNARKSVMITGTGLTVDIKDGVLLVLVNGNIAYAFAAGEWATVNQVPL